MENTENRCEMTDAEIFAEMVWDKLQSHEYIVVDGSVLDPENGDLICQLKILGLN